MTAPTSLATVYALDEDVAVQACGDYSSITPAWQAMARGTDGVFASGDLWTLTSASVDFLAAGVVYGHVIALTGPQAIYKGNGELFGVAAVAANSVRLRRIGLQDRVGQPPGPIGGLTGITFSCLTLYPQIEQASYQINQAFGIDPSAKIGPMRKPSDLSDMRAINTLCVLGVLRDLYEIANRVKGGEYDTKLKQTSMDYDDLKSKVVIRLGTSGEGEMPLSIFRTRTTR